MDNPIALLAGVPRIYRDFFDIMNILGCPWTSLENGPARHRIDSQIALFYRHWLNSIFAVTQEVTQTLALRFASIKRAKVRLGPAAAVEGRRSTYRLQDFYEKVVALR
jgi:hypothetical protein